MAVFKSLLANDITQTKSILNQLVDIVREDISGSNSRKSYEVFVTSSVGPGVTSSMYQTVFDQDFSLQTANSLFDITFGMRPTFSAINSTDIEPKVYLGTDGQGKKRYKQTSMMLREKQDIYRQFASTLLGTPTGEFKAPFRSALDSDKIDYALFFTFHRLFVRDGIKRETFAMRMKKTLGATKADGSTTHRDNLFQVEGTAEQIYTDFGSSTFQPLEAGGNVGNLVLASDTSTTVGLIFYDHGTVVLNAARVFDNNVGHGVISAMTDSTSAANTANSVYGAAGSIPAGKSLFGPESESGGNLQFAATSNTQGGTIFPWFFTSASIDDIVTHVCSTRFGSDSGTAVTFQNKTEINSSIYFIRAMPDEFNYSSNPTYLDANGNIQVIRGDNSRPFSYITTVGLYGNSDELLAVAKTSRPIEKNDEKDLTIRVRLDF